MNNLLEKVENTGGGIFSIIPKLITGERELANRQFHDSQAETPHIRLDCVLVALNSFGSHVGGCTHKGVGDRVNQLSGNTKIAKLDVALGVDEDVGGLDVSVHDVVLGVEVREAAECSFGNLSEDINANWTEHTGDTVERATYPRSVSMRKES